MPGIDNWLGAFDISEPARARLQPIGAVMQRVIGQDDTHPLFPQPAAAGGGGGVGAASWVKPTLRSIGHSLALVEASDPTRISHGTAFFIGPDRLLTAAHVLRTWQGGGFAAESLRLYPARGASDFPPQYVANWMLHPRWDATQPTGFDIAVLRIDSSCPAPSRWFGMVSDALHPGATINVAGYSQATVPAAAIYGAGKVSHCSATEFEHDADTFEGESGAPVIVWDGAVSGQLLVAGVHSRWETTPNLACLLRDEVIHWALNANLPDP